MSVATTIGSKRGKQLLLVVWILLLCVCFTLSRGGETHFVPRCNYSEYTNAIDAGNWIRNAINERRLAIGVSSQLPVPVNNSQAGYLASFKGDARSLIPHFINHSLANNNNFDTYFNTPATNGVYPQNFPVWTETGLLAHCSLPTNFFEHTPWRPFKGHGGGVQNEYTYGGFTTLDYGWEGLRAILCNLKWTCNGYDSWWILSKRTYWQNLYCSGTESADCDCDDDVDCSPTLDVDDTDYGQSGSLSIYKECNDSSVFDYTNGTLVECSASALSKVQFYSVKHRVTGLPTNFPSSYVDFYRMNSLGNTTNYSSWCEVSGLDWNGRSDAGNECPDNEEYWTNCVSSSDGHPFKYITTASITSSGTAQNGTSYMLDANMVEYFNKTKTYYCTVNSTPWSFEASSRQAKSEYWAYTIHLTRWNFRYEEN